MKDLINLDGSFYKKSKVAIVLTENGSHIHKRNEGIYYTPNIGKSIVDKDYHLYVLTDDEIKEGDWYLYSSNVPVVIKCIDISFINIPNVTKTKCKKIIASTDSSLIEDGIYEIPSEFVEEFCKVQGIWEVLVEPKIFKQGLMTFAQGYKVKNDELVIRFDMPNAEEVTIPVSLIGNILRYCEDKKICDKLGDYGDFYNQLKRQ